MPRIFIVFVFGFDVCVTLLLLLLARRRCLGWAAAELVHLVLVAQNAIRGNQEKHARVGGAAADHSAGVDLAGVVEVERPVLPQLVLGGTSSPNGHMFAGGVFCEKGPVPRQTRSCPPKSAIGMPLSFF